MNADDKKQAYKDALGFVQGNVGRDNFRPEHMANAIDKKFSVSFENNGVTTAENIKNQYKRDLATAMTKVIGDNGKMPDLQSSAYKNIVEPVVEGRAIKGIGLPTWKRMDDMAERYPLLAKTAEAKQLAQEVLKKAAQIIEPAADIAQKTVKAIEVAADKVGKVVEPVAEGIAKASHAVPEGSVNKAFNAASHSPAAKLIPGLKHVVALGSAFAAVSKVAAAETPEARRDAVKDMIVKGVEAVDPTVVGYIATGVHEAIGRKGDSPLKENLAAMSTGQRQTDPRVIFRQNGEIDRRQKFLEETQFGALQGKDGKSLDVAAILKDPQKRDSFITDLKNLKEKASPDSRETFDDMIMAAEEYKILEGRRRELTPAAPQLAPPQVVAAKQATFAPA